MRRVTATAAFVFCALLATAAHAEKLRVAVMPFESASSDSELESLGKGLQAMITTDLHEVGEYDLVERSRIADIQAELKLVKTGAIDKGTASKIGKLAGASHLLTGTVTVLGDQMRIDARMFGTSDGKILMAEKIEGAKAEFFDLEKALVKKLVGVTGVKMTPKVRVKVTRVHTADFKAFKTYSDGIQAFDRKDYKKSIALLKKAAKIDPDFKLATLTMEQYEQEIAAMKTRAVNVEIDKRRMAEIKQNEGAAKEVAKLDEYWAMARKQGKKDRIERLWGLWNLYYYYGDHYSRLRNLHRIEDRFELERIADAVAGQYFAEAQSAFPKVPLAPDYKQHWYWNREPRDDRERKNHQSYVTSVRKDWNELCARLHLDDKRCGDMMMRVAEKLKKAGADDEDLAKLLREAGERYRHAGAVDASTVAFSAAQKITTDSYWLKTLVKHVEANRDVKKLLKTCKGPWVREQLVLDGWSESFRGKCDDYTFRELAEPLSLEGRRALTSQRIIPKRVPLPVGDHPAWIFGSRDVRTGPRKTAHSTDWIVYYEKEPKDYGVLTVFDGRKTDDVGIRLDVSWDPLASWYPDSEYRPRKGQTEIKYNKARPRVVVAFGLVDVDVAMRDHPKTGKRFVPRPTRGYGIMLDGDGIHLVELQEDDAERELIRTNHHADLNLAWKRIGVKKLESKSTSVTDRGKVEVKVDLNGSKVRAKVGGTRVSWKLPKVRSGYYGVWVDGPGHVAFGEPKIK